MNYTHQTENSPSRNGAFRRGQKVFKQSFEKILRMINHKTITSFLINWSIKEIIENVIEMFVNNL